MSLSQDLGSRRLQSGIYRAKLHRPTQREEGHHLQRERRELDTGADQQARDAQRGEGGEHDHHRGRDAGVWWRKQKLKAKIDCTASYFSVKEMSSRRVRVVFHDVNLHRPAGGHAGRRAVRAGAGAAEREEERHVHSDQHVAHHQGLALVQFSVQRIKRFEWDRGCIEGVFRGCLGGVRGCQWCQAVSRVYFRSETAHVELESGRV